MTELFEKEKDLILKLVNLVLIIWLISAITFFHVSLVDIIMPDKIMTYDDYKATYCNFKIEGDDCQTQYEYEKDSHKRQIINRKKSMFMSMGNMVIVVTGIYIINKKRGGS